MWFLKRKKKAAAAVTKNCSLKQQKKSAKKTSCKKASKKKAPAKKTTLNYMLHYGSIKKKNFPNQERNDMVNRLYWKLFKQIIEIKKGGYALWNQVCLVTEKLTENKYLQ